MPGFDRADGLAGDAGQRRELFLRGAAPRATFNRFPRPLPSP
jgi:hypothetical protein